MKWFFFFQCARLTNKRTNKSKYPKHAQYCHSVMHRSFLKFPVRFVLKTLLFMVSLMNVYWYYFELKLSTDFIQI